MFHRIHQAFAAMAIAALLSSCASFPATPSKTTEPQLGGLVITSFDGSLLHFMAWKAEEPKAIILALHGMNDYSRSFVLPGHYWAKEKQITTYAIDQRGFGASGELGQWPGADTLKLDLRAALTAVQERHRDIPVYLLGHSMGAAVVIAAYADALLDAEGIILAAPAVWGGDALPLTHRATINIAANLFPASTLTGERAQRQATDNIEVLRRMSADPKVIKDTRLDTVLGVVRLMGEGFEKSPDVCARSLVLIGLKDEIVPLPVMETAAASLCGDKKIIRYTDGWHLLFRDQQRERVFVDVAEWIDRQNISHQNISAD